MKEFFFIALMSVAMLSFGQSVKVEGFVKDSIGNPLELANVIAFVKGTSKVQSYSITNDRGEYKLVLPTNATYSFRISYIGFQIHLAELNIPDYSEDIVNNDFSLKEEDNTLNEVELTFEMPVTIKGDTIIYDSDSFTNGTEKKLEDILKKLPGIEITEDGQIEVEGKVVQKVMVEGKDFFDGDSKIASKNIPSSAVAKIEVLRNYNEVTPMRGMGDDSDNVAINIRLKKGKENFWFGEITAGVGTDGRYLVHPKLFYYSPKTSVNVITDFNNVGEIPFTQQDYRRFSGGFRSPTGRGGTNFSVGSGGLGFSSLQNSMAKEVLSKFGAVNISHSSKKKLTLSGFAIANESEVEMFSQTVTRNIVTDNLELRENTNDQKSQLGMIKLSANYVPNTESHFDYDILMKMSKQEEIGLIKSVVNGEDEIIIDNQEQNPISINQNLSYYKVLKNNDVVSLEMQHLYQVENPLINFLRGSQPFQIIPTEPEAIYNMSQQQEVRTSKFDGKVDYYLIVNNKSNLNFRLGSTISHQNFDSNIFQILNDGSQLDFGEEELVNDITYQFNDIFFGLYYKTVAGKFTFTPGVTAHSYQTEDTQLGSANSNNDFEVLPDMLIQWKLKSSQNLRFNYAMTREYTDINRLSEGYLLNNFNSMFGGNRELESALYNRFNLNFFSFSMFNFTNMNASVTYSKKTNDIKNISDFIGFNQTIRTPYNSNLADETLSGNARYGRRFGKFKVNANMRLNYSKFNGIVNDNPNVSETFTQNFTGSFGTNLKNAPNLEVGYSKTFNQFESSSRSSDFTTDRPFAKLETLFLKDFSLVVDYSYYNYSDGTNTIENTYSFLDANLFYQKKDSKWEFILSGKNLTDNQSINRDSFTETVSRATSYYVMSLRVLFSIKYNL
mgnify:FL=1|jgi:hypothetical protein|tara:strand:+ start:86125 stop:88809 length:2685 start_codon:yes stop_codon:yes gene_type:complete